MEGSLGSGEVALSDSHLCQTVVSTIVVGEEACGSLEILLLLAGVVGQGSAIEKLLNAELAGIVLELLLDFSIGAADEFVVDGQASTTEFGEHLVSEFAEGHAHIANLSLALLGILIHVEDAEDDILVLNVAGSHDFLEAFPVLSGVLRINRSVEGDFLELRVHIVRSRSLTSGSYLLVEAQGTIGRSVCADFDIVESIRLLVSLDVAEHLHEVLDRSRRKFAGAYAALVDEILDLSILMLSDDLLISIGSHASVGTLDGAIDELAGGEHAVGHLHSRNVEGLLADSSVEGQIEFALSHLGEIVEGGLHGVVTAHLVADGLVVTNRLLTLEGGRLSLYGVTGIAEFGGYGDYSLLLHVLHGEATVDGGGHLAGAFYERVRRYSEIVGREFAELAATGQEKDGKSGCSQKYVC